MSHLVKLNNLAEAIRSLQANRAEYGQQPCDTAVILHLYYPDLWAEIRGYLANLGDDFDLFVSVCATAKESDVALIKQHYPSAIICHVENRGRDIGPFMETYPVIAGQYRYICKIHSKKSLHYPSGSVWRQNLYKQLLGTPKRIEEIKALFDCFPHIGLVGPKGYLLQCRNFLGMNAEKIIELAKKMGVNETGDFCYYYPTGSMFWFKPEAFTPLLKLSIRQESFENEQGQIDGTLAHAVERVFPLAATVVGYETVDTHILEIFKEIFGADNFYNSHHLKAFRDNPKLLMTLTKCVYALYERDREIDMLRNICNEINILKNSTSWKVTAPLRLANSFFSRLIGKKQ